MANKKRLVDADALFNNLADYWGILKDWDGRIHPLCDDALSTIDNFPTVDAVEVVRCKDCKRCTQGKSAETLGRFCERFSVFVQADDFCSYGERKGDGNV